MSRKGPHPAPSGISLALLALLLLLAPPGPGPAGVAAFAPNAAHRGRAPPLPSSLSQLRAAGGVVVSSPTPDEAADMGARDWPQQVRKAPGWSESVAEDGAVTRYVLSGTGSVAVKGSSQKIGPGSLVEVTGPAEVEWAVSGGGDGEMIILTPGYEEAGLLVGVAAALVVLCAALVVAS